MLGYEKGKPLVASLFFRLFYAVFLAACQDKRSPTNTSLVRIEPTAESFTIRKQSRVVSLDAEIEIENRSTHPILWSECGMALERNQYVMALDRRTEEWLEVWRPSCPDTDEAQKVLREGEAVTVPLHVLPSGASSFHGETGVYRVRFFLSADIAGEYHQLGPELSISRSFTVVDTK